MRRIVPPITARVSPRATALLAAALAALPIVACDTSVGLDDTEGPFEVAFIGTVDNQPGLHLARTDGTGFTSVTSGDAAPRWYAVSPDGEKIAVLLTGSEAGTDIYIVNRDGSGLVNLTNTPDQWDGWMSWSPDGTRIVYDQPVPSADGGGQDIWVANADGSGATNLTPPLGGHYDGGARWSPDGTKLVFVSIRSGNPDIWVMNADGSNPVNLTQSPDSNEGWPAWSPDGSRIAFGRTTNDAPGDIYVINPDGTGLANVTQNPVRNDNAPLWSPDGTRLLFTAEWPDAPTRPDIFVMTLDGLEQINVSDHEGFDAYPSWSPDGSMIAFTSFRDGLRQVYVVGADGTGLRRLIEPAAGETARENWLESMAAWGPGH
jgi:Tol biopolymer transport system component